MAERSLKLVHLRIRHLLMQKYFCTVYDYVGKAELNMGYWDPERKLGAAGHFLEIIRQQYYSKMQ